MALDIRLTHFDNAVIAALRAVAIADMGLPGVDGFAAPVLARDIDDCLENVQWCPQDHGLSLPFTERKIAIFPSGWFRRVH